MVKVQTGADFLVGRESFSTFVFEFLEGEEYSREFSLNSDDSEKYEEADYEVGMLGSINNFEVKAFWELKDQFLQATLSKCSSIESKIRSATKEAIRGRRQAGSGCNCRSRRHVANGCRDCLQREITDTLRMTGYNCAICKSKWKSSLDIPSGEHTYLEVLDNSNPEKGEVRVIIEYNKLISRLPEVFVGKAERLNALIKILCSAAKKCMSDQKMHMGPWRKYKYMKAKWSGSCERRNFPLTRRVEVLHQLSKPAASMLTCDLVDNLPVLHLMGVN